MVTHKRSGWRKCLYWCNSHSRRATHLSDDGTVVCDRRLGGIMLPCRVVDLTDEVELIEDDDGENKVSQPDVQ